MARIPSTAMLTAFEVAAREESFSRAAEALSLTPGAVSRQILALEELLHVRLFNRSHKRVALTEAGRAYFADIREPLAEIAAATARISVRRPSDAVAIVAYPTFAVRWLIPRWGRFHDAHPDIDLQLKTSLNPVDFTKDAYDMAIRVAEDGESGPGLAAEKLIDVELVPVAAPEVARRFERPEDLSRATLLHGDPRPADWRRWLAHAGCGGIDAERGLRFESLNLTYQAAIEGLGVAIGIRALIRDELRAGRLVPLFDLVRRSRRPIRLVYPEWKVANPEFATVRAWLLSEAAADDRC